MNKWRHSNVLPTMLSIYLFLLCGGVSAAEKVSKVDKIDKVTLAAAKESVKGILKDPDSAKFSNIKSNSNGDICGEYNAKNSYGGYGEPSVFMYVKMTKELLNIKAMQLKEEHEELVESNDKTRRLIGYTPVEMIKNAHAKKDKYFEFVMKMARCEPQ